MKKLEISTTAFGGFTTGFLVPTTGGGTGGVCLQPVRRRPDLRTAGVDATRVADSGTPWGMAGDRAASAAPSPGLPTSAPPIT